MGIRSGLGVGGVERGRKEEGTGGDGGGNGGEWVGMGKEDGEEDWEEEEEGGRRKGRRGLELGKGKKKTLIDPPSPPPTHLPPPIRPSVHVEHGERVWKNVRLIDGKKVANHGVYMCCVCYVLRQVTEICTTWEHVS